jgi:hypothetical protein
MMFASTSAPEGSIALEQGVEHSLAVVAPMDSASGPIALEQGVEHSLAVVAPMDSASAMLGNFAVLAPFSSETSLSLMSAKACFLLSIGVFSAHEPFLA